MPPAFPFFFQVTFEKDIPYLKRITILRDHKIYFCIRKSYAKKFFAVMPVVCQYFTKNKLLNKF